MKRPLLAFAGLLVVMVLAAIAFLHTAGFAIESFRMAPRVAFAPQAPLPPKAYDNPALWIARPDMPGNPAAYLPTGMVSGRAGPAYVFFVHATSFFGRNHWNAPLTHVDSQIRAAHSVQAMASAFNGESGVFAPHYRQATLGSFFIDDPASERAEAVAEGDVRLAFAKFLRSVPADAPIVLAGHDQGSLILLHLMRDIAHDGPLASRIVAIYLAGWPVYPGHDLAVAGLHPCRASDQVDCVMSWITFAQPADPAMMRDLFAHYPALDGTHPHGEPILCVNPLTGGAATDAPDSANRGSLALADEYHRAGLILPATGAHCDPASGILLVNHAPRIGELVLPGNNYTAYDYAIFWRNLRDDVQRRTMAWIGTHSRGHTT